MNNQFFGYKIAYRTWFAHSGEVCEETGVRQYRLGSVVIDQCFWPVGVPLMCPDAERQIKSDVHYGIHSYNNVINLREYAKIVDASGVKNTKFSNEPMIVGEVKIWGHIYVHELGYRSQFAYPHKFYAFEESSMGYDSLVNKLARIYKVPVEYHNYDEIRKKNRV